ncbi:MULTISPECIES: hypothetical protein [unclassified Peribacillus]|uniref:hypothetical protein n=1 Tax=unclassified Peribacillus TaxID=2675266 RepID=UPI003827C973
MNKIETKEQLYIVEPTGLLPELLFLDDIEILLTKLGYPVPIHYDWWCLYMKLYEGKNVSDTTFNEFKIYINKLSPYLFEVTAFIKEQYKTIGRFELLKKINVI